MLVAGREARRCRRRLTNPDRKRSGSSARSCATSRPASYMSPPAPCASSLRSILSVMKPRKKAKPYGAVKASSSAEHKLLIWILQLSLVSLSRCLSAVSAPFGRLLCVQLFVGRSCGKLLTWLKGLVFHLVAWFCGPAVSRNHWIQRWSRSYGVEVIRRCHVVLGECGSGGPRAAGRAPGLPLVCIGMPASSPLSWGPGAPARAPAKGARCADLVSPVSVQPRDVASAAARARD